MPRFSIRDTGDDATAGLVTGSRSGKTLEHDDNDHDGESEDGDEYARVPQCVTEEIAPV